jgi:hypothetical protein
VNNDPQADSAAYEPPLLTTIGSVLELTLIETDDAIGSGRSKPV